MFNWLKKLFGKKEPVAQIQITEAPKLLEKPCRNCGNPVFYDPSWEHIPNYCKDCKRKFQQSNAKIITAFVGSVRARSGKCCWIIAIFLGGFPTAFCKTEIKNDQNVIRFFESDAQSGQAIGTPGGIRTHGLPLRRSKKCSPLLFPEVPLSLAIAGFLTFFTVRIFLQNTPVFPQCC